MKNLLVTASTDDTMVYYDLDKDTEKWYETKDSISTGRDVWDF